MRPSFLCQTFYEILGKYIYEQLRSHDMDEKIGFELIQGKGNHVSFDSSCPGCGDLVKELAWIEDNSFLTQIQCPVCKYDKVNAIQLANEGLSGIKADIEIKKSLFEMAGNGNVSMLIWLGNQILHQK